MGVVSAAVVDSRSRFGWSQRELSRRSGIPQSRISSIERVRLRSLRVVEIDRLFGALGIRYWLGVDSPRLVAGLQRDIVHARCSVHVARRLEAEGWLIEREVEIGDGRSRGWIDLLAFDPRSGLLLVIEIKTEIHDIGGIERTMNWYQREATSAARRFGWAPRRIQAVLLVLHSRQNDRSLSTARVVFERAFPGRATELRAVVAGSTRTSSGQYVAMIDPRSRRSMWLRATPLEGRRSVAPYEDYVDAVRLMTARSGVRGNRGSGASTR